MTLLKKQAEDLKQIAASIESHVCDKADNLITIVLESKHRQRLTPNFYIGEFMCRDGSTLILIDKRLSEGLQRIRAIIGKPVIITSAFRTPEHNAAVGGADESRHKTGQAADIVVQGMTPDQVADIARQVGFRGIGIYRTFTHVDVRDAPAEWRG